MSRYLKEEININWFTYQFTKSTILYLSIFNYKIKLKSNKCFDLPHNVLQPPNYMGVGTTWSGGSKFSLNFLNYPRSYFLLSSSKWSLNKFSVNAGVQTRNVWCAKRRDSSEVSRDLCNDALEPLSTQQCAPEPCAPQWTSGEWGPCSQSCGTGGTQTRQVRITLRL